MAVYTEVSNEELEEFLAQYDIGEVLSLKGITEGIENSNFLLHTDRDLYILTLYEKRVKPDELPYFLDLMNHLHAKGISCPLPVPGKDGRALRDLCGRKACVSTFLKGMSTRKIMPDHCAELGRAMAQMHLAAEGFKGTRRNDLSVEGWENLLEKIGKEADNIAPDLYSEMKQELYSLKSYWPSGLPQGVIHADLFPDNVFFLGKKLSGIIDFYFACNDAFAYELAVCLNAWCFEPEIWEFNTTKAARMLAAYDRIRPLSKTEKEKLPVLARGSALRFLLTRTFDWLNRTEGALVRPKNPLEYLRKLRFHRGIKTYHEYGYFV